MKVLDHGFVELIDTMGNDDSIVRAARVSHAATRRSFEHVLFTFHVKAPIFVFRQWHRHRTWSFNEVSARYTELPEEFYVPTPELLGKQCGKNHQSRNITEHDYDPVAAQETVDMMRSHNKSCFAAYHWALERGVPREVARTVLPVATYSEMYATVDLHNLMHFLDLRLDEHSQYEIRVYAEAIYAQIGDVAPAALAAWEVMRDGR